MTVVVYTKDRCPKCNLTKAKLKALEVDFVEVNIDRSELDYERAKGLSEKYGYTQMPIVIIGENEPVFGFQPDVVTELIKVAS